MTEREDIHRRLLSAAVRIGNEEVSGLLIEAAKEILGLRIDRFSLFDKPIEEFDDSRRERVS